MAYDEGRFVDATLVDPADLDHYRATADIAWQTATPFNEWWKAHPEYHRRAQPA